MRTAAVSVGLGLSLFGVAHAEVDLASGEFSLPDTLDSEGWERLEFEESFAEPPVLIVSPGASPGGQPFTVKVQNVSETGADIQTWEPAGAGTPSWHLDVDGTYFAIRPGVYHLPGGLTVVAGTVETSALQADESVVSGVTSSWDLVDFGYVFDSPPIVMATIQTANNERGVTPATDHSAPWMVAAVDNITESGFDLALDKGQADDIDDEDTTEVETIVAETVGFVAVTRDVSGIMVDAVGDEVFYESIYESVDEETSWGIDNPAYCLDLLNDYETVPPVVASLNSRRDSDGGWIQISSLSTTSVCVRCNEDMYTDSERSHSGDDFSYLILEPGQFDFTDTDGDGLFDTFESFVTLTDPTDADSDDDGISDGEEYDAGMDPTASGGDVDGDGIADADEWGEDGPADTDGDGVPDYLDEDSDGDGFSDAEEGVGDTDGDGLGDFIDVDSDGDGLLDATEGSTDFDLDGVPDRLDEDSDNDGVSDLIEGDGDLDGDGVPNCHDDDSDGDGILDADEGADDPDGDGVPSFLDDDADGDGISDLDEGSDDPDGDGIPSSLDTDSDGDGISDSDEGAGDTDGDGTPDYLDEDSDGDGLSDAGELAAGTDPSGGVSDADGDGVDDALEDWDGDGDPSNDDTDGDGIPDVMDADDDGDGIDTIDEDTDGDGDPSNDDLDGDGLPNCRDTDSDGDGLSDAEEIDLGTDPYDLAGDADEDGLYDYEEVEQGTDPHNPDTDGDGWTDGEEVNEHGTDPNDAQDVPGDDDDPSDDDPSDGDGSDDGNNGFELGKVKGAKDGCGCATTGSPSHAVWLLGLVALAGRRRQAA